MGVSTEDGRIGFKGGKDSKKSFLKKELVLKDEEEFSK